MATSKDYDILVVGIGAAGCSAALSSLETAGSLDKSIKVLMLEKTGEKDWGGNSRWTTANFRMIDDNHLYPTFEDDVIKDSNNMVDKNYLHRLALEAVATINWVRAHGVNLERRPDNWTFSGFKMGPEGGGLEIITALRTQAERLGASIIFENTAYKLLQDDEGIINGMVIRDRNGKSKNIFAGAVILAGGGFEGNFEMMTRYLGREATSFRMDVPSTKLHMGECITMAFDIGAAPSGDFGSYHGDVVDLRSSTYRPSIRAYLYGIIVNTRAERFVDEGMDEMSNSFEFIARSVFSQSEHRAYLIFDQKALSIPNFKKNIKSEIPPLEASNLEELAKKINVLPASLSKTVDEYNRAVQPGVFDPGKLDGKHTKGIYPSKTNWAMEIDKPPYICYPIESTMQFTWGGVASDPQGRVLATNGAPIPGLYAAGEMVGFYYRHYTPGTAVLRALTYGRIAGFEAVRWLMEE